MNRSPKRISKHTGFGAAENQNLVTIASSQPSDDLWPDFMKSAVRSRAVLLKELELNGELASKSDEIAHLARSTRLAGLAENDFPIFVTRPFLDRIEKGNWNDPLLKQILPVAAEQQAVDGYFADPLAEAKATRLPGMLQKYHGRALIVATSVCAINCRYCFRRHFPYQQISQSHQHRQALLEQIAIDPTINEVILSGGDPLLMVDPLLAHWFNGLAAISHVKKLRIHTRLPIMIPRRVTRRLLEMIRQTELSVVVVIHSNHARELDQEVETALKAIGSAGAMLLNQAVLLSGINDNLETLTGLSERLIECRVLPYYLHKNDPIAGTAHFEVSIERGIELIEQMRAILPGYAVPRFAQEIAGELNKRVLA